MLYIAFGLFTVVTDIMGTVAILYMFVQSIRLGRKWEAAFMFWGLCGMALITWILIDGFLTYGLTYFSQF